MTIQQSVGLLHVFPIDIDSIDEGTLRMDLYYLPGGNADLVLYRAVGVTFTEEHRQRLAEQGVKHLYIPIRQHREYRHMLSERLDRIFRDPDMNRSQRKHLVRRSCTKMIEDVLLFPKQTSKLDIVADVAKQFARWSEEEHSEFACLLEMSAHDYYTVAHMVNVGLGCGLLARELKPDDRDFQEVIIEGGLLHDVGKRGISEEVLNKEGGLEPDEWEILRKHPQKGVNLIKRHPRTPHLALEMVGGHHEYPDGSGYPNGYADENVTLAMRICTVVDVYDAITSARFYRQPVPPRETIRIMREGRGSHFDEHVFDVWVEIVDRLVTENPEMLGKVDLTPQQKYQFMQFVPRAPVSALDHAGRGGMGKCGAERRNYERHPCNISVKGRLTWAGKRYPVPAGQWLDFRAKCISQSGIQLVTPWPLSINDVVELKLPVAAGRVATRQALVVRVREAKNGDWTAGMKFLKKN